MNCESARKFDYLQRATSETSGLGLIDKFKAINYTIPPPRKILCS